jgi:diguanylate cyclase (GGDEF)-like protein
MMIYRWLRPRDHEVAARTASILAAVAAAVTVVFSLITPSAGTDRAVTVPVTVIVSALIVAGAWTLSRTHNDLIWAVVPFAAIGGIALLDQLSRDTSVGGLVFFFFPALYGASQLRRNGAAAVTGAVLVASAVVLFSQLPVGRAEVYAVSLDAALITSVALLVLANERQEQLVLTLQRQAAIDPLTGLVTRRVLDDAARSALSSTASGDGTAMVLIDVDEFKAINDNWGHPGGDAVLVELARLLDRLSRPNDIVSRLGGDEVALLLPGCRSEVAEERGEAVRRAVRAHPFPVGDGQTTSVSISVGIAHAPTHAFDLRSLYAAADAALYSAKRSGRDRSAVPTSAALAVVGHPVTP